MFELSKNFNTSYLESFLYGILYKNVSNNVFASTLPNNIHSKWNDMVIIDCESPMIDFDSHANGTIFIHLYARPLSNGTKNVMKMKELEDKLCNVIENNNNDDVRISRLSTQSGYDTNIKWHRNSIEFIINILN